MTSKGSCKAALLALMLFTCGCVGAVRHPTYYSLALVPQIKVAPENSTHPVTVVVRQFETPAYLRQGRIVYREHPEQVGFYEYHRWATDPGATVTTAVADSLQSSRFFSYAGSYDSTHRAAYLLTGRLERLDEIDYGGGVRVEATVSAQMVDLRTGALVWSGNATNTANVEGHDVNSVVTQMSHAVDLCLEKLVSSIGEAVDRRDIAQR